MNFLKMISAAVALVCCAAVTMALPPLDMTKYGAGEYKNPGKTYYVQLQARVPKSSGGYQYSGYCDPITVPITMPQA